MGRLGKAKVDEIGKLREEGYTQKETAEKVGVHLITVRKYDPLREQKPVSPTAEQDNEFQEACNGLVAMGLVQEEGNGQFKLSSLGRRTNRKFEKLQRESILEFMKELDRPVKEEEIEKHFDEVYDELFDEAFEETKRTMGWSSGKAY